MRIQLIWTDPNTQQTLQPIFALPIALGRSYGLMPSLLDGQPISRIVLTDNQVEIYHALLEEIDGSVTISSQGDAPLSVNGISFSSTTLEEGDRIQIGPFDLAFKLPADADITPTIPVEAEDIPPPIMPPPTTPLPVPTEALPVQPSPELSMPVDDLASGLSSAPVTSAQSSGDWKCDRKVGFLFKRPCERTTQQGCPHCRNGQVRNDPYFHDYDLYPGYGRYGTGYWGHSYYRDRHRYRYNRDTRDMDFTEADAASFENENDTDYEMDYGAS